MAQHTQVCCSSKPRSFLQVPTSEELKDEHAAANLLEDVTPYAASALKAALADIQNVVSPEDPTEDEVDQGKGQNDRAGCCVRQGYDVYQHHGTNLPAVSDTVWP